MFTGEAKWTHTGLRFQTGMKQVLFNWRFISAVFQNDPIFWWTYIGISFRVVFTWYFITQNEISFLLKICNEITFGMSFKRTCALNAISNEYTLILFASSNFCSHENLMPVWNFISVKMTNMKSIPVWVSFCLNSCEHKLIGDWTPKWDFQPKWNFIPV